MRARQRIERLRGRHALVDGIPFALPVDSRDTPALMAAFPISAARAAELIPGEEVHPFRLGRRHRPARRDRRRLPDHRHRVVHRILDRHCLHARAGPGAGAAAGPAPGPLRHRAVRGGPARLDGGLGQGRQGHLGHAEAPGQPRLRDPQGQGLEPVRPRRPAVLPDRGGHAALDRPADEPARGELLRVPRHAEQVVHLLPRPRRDQAPVRARGSPDLRRPSRAWRR